MQLEGRGIFLKNDKSFKNCRSNKNTEIIFKGFFKKYYHGSLKIILLCKLPVLYFLWIFKKNQEKSFFYKTIN